MEEMELEAEQPLEEQTSFDELLRGNREYQSAFDRRVQKALQTARTNWEREREQALEEQRAGALEDARRQAEAEYRQRQTELDTREGEFAHRVRQVSVADALVRRGLPADFAPWLTGETEEESTQRLEQFDAAFRSAVSDSVTQRMAGAPPTEASITPVYDRDTLRGMSPREINAHWAEIQTALSQGN